MGGNPGGGGGSRSQASANPARSAGRAQNRPNSPERGSKVKAKGHVKGASLPVGRRGSKFRGGYDRNQTPVYCPWRRAKKKNISKNVKTFRRDAWKDNFDLLRVPGIPLRSVQIPSPSGLGGGGGGHPPPTPYTLLTPNPGGDSSPGSPVVCGRWGPTSPNSPFPQKTQILSHSYSLFRIAFGEKSLLPCAVL